VNRAFEKFAASRIGQHGRLAKCFDYFIPIVHAGAGFRIKAAGGDSYLAVFPTVGALGVKGLEAEEHGEGE